mgnify:CR=1 FL=1
MQELDDRPSCRAMVDPPDLRSSLTSEPLPAFGTSIELVQRFQCGEQSALQDLLCRYQDRLRRIVRVRLGSSLRSHLESMDIVQEANLVAMRKLGEFQPRTHASLLQWLSSIVLHQIMDANKFLHASKRDVDQEVRVAFESADRALESLAPGLETAARPSQRPDERAAAVEIRAIIDECVTRLPANQREAVLQRDYFGAEWTEVADAVGCPNVHAAQELHRRAWVALRRLARPKLGDLA